MNCCDANGRCTCSTGTPRTCDELGVCQGLTPPCTYADGKTVACPTPLHLAPGAVEGYRAPFLGTPAQRRELVRLLKFGALWMVVFGLSGFAAGLIAGWQP
jgi:hypothetical protein